MEKEDLFFLDKKLKIWLVVSTWLFIVCGFAIFPVIFYLARQLWRMCMKKSRKRVKGKFAPKFCICTYPPPPLPKLSTLPKTSTSTSRKTRALHKLIKEATESIKEHQSMRLLRVCLRRSSFVQCATNIPLFNADL